MPRKRQLASLILIVCMSLIILRLERNCRNGTFWQCLWQRIRTPSHPSMNNSQTLRQQYNDLHEILDKITKRAENARLQAMERIFKNGMITEAGSVQRVRTFISPVKDENYFLTVSNFSHVSLVQFQTTLDEIMRAVNTQTFHVVSNNCTLMSEKTTGTPLCRQDLSSLLVEQVFSMEMFGIGMPAGKLVVDGEQITLTYLHIIQHAVVLPEGDVYSQGVRLVPWRCQSSAPAAPAARRKALLTYDEVRQIHVVSLRGDSNEVLDKWFSNSNDWRLRYLMTLLLDECHWHGTGTEIRYQDPSALPWSKMATATTGKDVYTAIIPRQWWLDLV